MSLNHLHLTDYEIMRHLERCEKAATQRHGPRATDYARTIQRERLVRFARASRPKALGELSQSPGSATSAFNLGSLSTRTSQAVRAYWWVPAGFAVLVLLRAIIGA